MSTKTTFKRVALVAVAALGFGVLTSVAPASAAERTPTSITLGTGSPARAGQVTSVSVGASFATALADNDTMTVAAKVLSAPTGSLTKTATAGVLANTIVGNGTTTNQTGVLVFNGGVTAASTSDSVLNTNATAAVAGISSVAVSAVVTRNSTSTTSTAWSGLSLKFTPDVAGTYTILVSAGNTTFTTGNASAVWTITTGGAPTKITVTQLGGQVVTGGTNGVAIAVDLTDANGNATVLAADEGIAISTTDTTVTLGNATFGPGQDTAGTYYTKAIANGTVAAGSAVITFKGNGLISPTVVTNTSVSKVVTTAWPATETAACTTAAACVVVGTATTSALNIKVKAAAALTISGLASSATVATQHKITVTTADDDTYDSYVSVAATTTALTSTATTTVTAPAASLTADSVLVLGRLTVT